jgi:tetratricopeptide (TPR) repeat protein
MLGNIPATPDNMAIDEKGLIYTVTRGEGQGTLKRLNIAGSNMIELERGAYDDVPAAVTTGNHDNVYVVSQQGYIYEYTNEGELLFVFGGSDDGMQRIGLSTKAEAIQTDHNDRIYVLDSDKKQVIIYTPTEFTNHLHEALYLFSKGRYTESKEPLDEVLRMNNLFDYANMAMGKTLFKEENYQESIEYARLSKDYETYSDSFWEIRNVWLKQNLATVFILCIVAFVLVKVIGALDKKKHILDPIRVVLDKIRSKKLIKQMGYMFFFMKHPIDGCYGIRKEGRVSVLSANMLLIIGIIEFIINKYFCGFLFKMVREGEYDILSDIGFIVLVLVLVVSCNYLMCTINDGEGRFKHIYCSLIYSFGPYLVIQPILFVLSHVVTVNEEFFVSFGNLAMLVWVGVLIFLSIKEINNYSVKETIVIIGLTIFTILIVCLLAFIIYVLSSQVIDFVESIFREVVYKIGN